MEAVNRGCVQKWPSSKSRQNSAILQHCVDTNQHFPFWFISNNGCMVATRCFVVANFDKKIKRMPLQWHSEPVHKTSNRKCWIALKTTDSVKSVKKMMRMSLLWWQSSSKGSSVTQQWEIRGSATCPSINPASAMWPYLLLLSRISHTTHTRATEGHSWTIDLDCCFTLRLSQEPGDQWG